MDVGKTEVTELMGLDVLGSEEPMIESLNKNIKIRVKVYRGPKIKMFTEELSIPLTR